MPTHLVLFAQATPRTGGLRCRSVGRNDFLGFLVALVWGKRFLASPVDGLASALFRLDGQKTKLETVASFVSE